MITDTYAKSQQRGEIDPLLTASNSTIYRENAVTTPITSGLLSKPMNVDYSRTLIDQGNCATYTELIITDPRNPHVVGTQIRFRPTTANGKLEVVLIDSVVATTGHEGFNATGTLRGVEGQRWDSIARANQPNREGLKAVADVYLDLWDNTNTSSTTNTTGTGTEVVLVYDTPCVRLQGGELVTESCVPPVITSQGVKGANTDRRYVIDETVGGVSVFSSFGSKGGVPDSHEFRIVEGKVQFVQQILAAKEEV